MLPARSHQRPVRCFVAIDTAHSDRFVEYLMQATDNDIDEVVYAVMLHCFELYLNKAYERSCAGLPAHGSDLVDQLLSHLPLQVYDLARLEELWKTLYDELRPALQEVQRRTPYLLRLRVTWVEPYQLKGIYLEG